MSIKRVKVMYIGPIKIKDRKFRGPIEINMDENDIWRLLNTPVCSQHIFALNDNGDKVRLTKDNYRKTTEELFDKTVTVEDIKTELIESDNVDNLEIREDIKESTTEVEKDEVVGDVITAYGFSLNDDDEETTQDIVIDEEPVEITIEPATKEETVESDENNVSKEIVIDEAVKPETKNTNNNYNKNKNKNKNYNKNYKK